MLYTPLSPISAVTNVPFLPSPPTAEIYYGRGAVFRYNPKYKIMHLAMLLENAIGEDTGMISTGATSTHVYSACMAQIPEPSFPDISVILAKSTSSPTQSHQPCSTHSPSSLALASTPPFLQRQTLIRTSPTGFMQVQQLKTVYTSYAPSGATSSPYVASTIRFG